MSIIKKRLATAQSCQKNYADKRCRELHFLEGDHVFIKVTSTKVATRFGLWEKLKPRYIGPFNIIVCNGDTEYRVALPSSLEYVHNVIHILMLQRYSAN